MMVPTVHLNGTPQGRLLEQFAEASYKLVETLEAMRAAAPNGRDYYPQGQGALAQAIAEHDGRITRLLEIKAEIDTLAERVADQG